MSKHTEGPWEYKIDSMDCPYVASRTKRMIADVNLVFVSAKEAKANARLISKAPEMLSLLKKVRKDIGHFMKLDDEKELDALIAQIEGA